MAMLLLMYCSDSFIFMAVFLFGYRRIKKKILKDVDKDDM